MQEINNIKYFFITQFKKSLVLKVIGALLSLIAHIVPARILNLDYYSIYSYTLSLFFIFLLISKLGIDIATVKYVASLKNDLNQGKIKGYIKEAIRTIFFSSLSMAIILLFLLFFFKNKLLFIYFNTFVIFVLIIPIVSIQDFLSGAFRGYSKIIYSELPESIIKPLLFFVFLFIFIFFEFNLNSAHFALIFFLACFATLAISLITFYQVIFIKLKKIKTIKFYKLLKNSLPILFGSGLYLIIIQTDLVMLGLISEVKNVGLYAPAAKISSFIFFIVSIFTVFTSPLFSELYKSKNFNKLKKIIKMTTIYSSIIALVFIILIIFFGKFILSIYGYNFTSSYIAMLILSISYFFTTTTVAREFMIMSDLHNESAKIIFITLFFNIILNYIFISQYGINGAAIATALSLFLMNIIMTFVVYKKTSINPTIFQ